MAVLLNHFKWDKDVLMEQFFSDKQQDIMREAKVVWPIPNMDKINLSNHHNSPGTSFECDICLCIASRNVSTNIFIGNAFCPLVLNRPYFSYPMDKSVDTFSACPAGKNT